MELSSNFSTLTFSKNAKNSVYLKPSENKNLPLLKMQLDWIPPRAQEIYWEIYMPNG